MSQTQYVLAYRGYSNIYIHIIASKLLHIRSSYLTYVEYSLLEIRKTICYILLFKIQDINENKTIKYLKN